MFSGNVRLRVPALVASGLFSLFTPTSPAEEIAPSPADERARAAEMADTVTANGERRTAEDPLIIAQVSSEPAQESPFPDEAESERVVVTGTNINSSDSPPFVPETIVNREAVERTGSRSLGDFFQSLPQNSGPSFTENQNESLAPGGAAAFSRLPTRSDSGASARCGLDEGE